MVGQGASRIPRAPRTALSSQSLIAPLSLPQSRPRAKPCTGTAPSTPSAPAASRPATSSGSPKAASTPPTTASIAGRSSTRTRYSAASLSRPRIRILAPFDGAQPSRGQMRGTSFPYALFSPTSCEDVGISLRLRWLVARAGERRTRRGFPGRIICAQAPVHTVPKSHHSPAARWVAERMANHSRELYHVHMAHAAILLSRLRSSTKPTSPVRDPISLMLNSSARCAPSQMSSSLGVSRRATLSPSTCL